MAPQLLRLQPSDKNPHDKTPMHSTLSERLNHLSTECGTQPAIIEPHRKIDYATLDRHSRNLAGHFSRTGFKAGDRVALWLPNCIEWVECLLACARLGVTVISVNTRFRSHEVQDVIERGKTRWLIYWPEFKGIGFKQILDDIDPFVIESLKASLTLDQIQGFAETDCEPPEAHGDHGVITFTTSGTTSLPKFVLHTQTSLICHADAIANAFQYDESTRVLASAPFCGTFGFSTLSGGLLTGRPVICEPVSDAHSLLNLIREHRITHTFANNSLIQQIMEASNSRDDFLSCRLFGFAAFAPALGDLFDMALKNGLPLTGLYGSSELQALLAAQPTDPTKGDLSVLHQPGGLLVHPTARVRTRDPETGHLLPHGQSGELEILSPSHMSAYLDQPEETHKAFTEDGYFKTGDLGTCVSDQQFVFQARMGDSLRLGGFLVNPAEIEQAVEELPGVLAAQIVGAQKGDKLVPVAFVLIQSGYTSIPDEWAAQCKRRLAGFKVPVHFEVLDDFPTVQSANSTKIQKHRLREMAQSILDSLPAGS